MYPLQMKKLSVLVVLIGTIFASLYIVVDEKAKVQERDRPWKLYWFVPDGLRAEPDVFRIFDWARAGHLPNIRLMMEQGAYGYSIPVFPSHTPVNFATLFTGVRPDRHGIADGPIRIRGYPLKVVSQTGFSSVAKTIDPFWYTLEQAGKIVTLLSIPGSTPPEITTGQIVKGRWGGWGVEFPNLIVHSDRDYALRDRLGANDKVFQYGKKLTEFAPLLPPADWVAPIPKSFSPPLEMPIEIWGTMLFALIIDESDDQIENYDRVFFSKDRREFLFDLPAGEWGPWFELELHYLPQHVYQDHMPQRMAIEQDLAQLAFRTQTRVRVIRLGRADGVRIRVLFDGLNSSVTSPPALADSLRRASGPMVDFVDNYPPQLVYFPEDREAFLEESNFSFDWHRRAQNYFFDHENQDVFVHSIYSPNQMLTSRWWMGRMDPSARAFSESSAAERRTAHDEVLRMYQQVDDIVGEALRRRPSDAFVVLSSDHGVVPLNYEVRLNNLFAQMNWLTFGPKTASGMPTIDWARSKVVFLNMNHVYIRPEGLGGNYRPSAGAAYERLRDEVILVLKSLEHEGVRAVEDIRTREQAVEWGLPPDRIGDLVVANRAGFSWVEDISVDGEIFVSSLKAGYKQAVLPENNKGLWTPFLIVGPGIKAGHSLARPIRHVDQYPTIMKLLGVKPPHETDGEVLRELEIEASRDQ